MAAEARHVDPRLLEAAEQSPTLRRMIRDGLPLNRKKWINLNYLGHPPKPWTAEHEGEVPAPWRDFANVEDD
jgi:hypothetical protein